jgi:hypothetical protein
MIEIAHHDTREQFDFGLAELALHAEELESLEALSWGGFLKGFVVGAALGAMPVVAVAIT